MPPAARSIIRTSPIPRILSALCAPGVDAATVAGIVGQEPGLTARVLRVANSAYYGRPREIATLDRAIVVLGLDAVRGIAAAACLDRGLLRSPATAAVDMDAVLRHSVTAAAAAESLGRLRHRTLAGEAFIAALLHDFGVVVQLHLAVDPMVVRATELRTTPRAIHPAEEREQVGTSHADCVAVVFEAWQLPAALVDAVRHHHEPANAPEAARPVTALVHLGDLLALRLESCHAFEVAPGEPDAALDLLGLTAEELDAVGAALPERVAELRTALGGP